MEYIPASCQLPFLSNPTSGYESSFYQCQADITRNYWAIPATREKLEGNLRTMF